MAFVISIEEDHSTSYCFIFFLKYTWHAQIDD